MSRQGSAAPPSCQHRTLVAAEAFAIGVAELVGCGAVHRHCETVTGFQTLLAAGRHNKPRAPIELGHVTNRRRGWVVSWPREAPEAVRGVAPYVILLSYDCFAVSALLIVSRHARNPCSGQGADPGIVLTILRSQRSEHA